jgi:simple sugar transport system ATP-binding protein
MTLSLTKIRKSFGSFLALDNAHFTARRGEVHALVGENGAGKSSLMNVAAGFYAADSGTIMKDGVKLSFSGPGEARANRIGMVHQHFKLVRRFSVAENILLANPGGGAYQPRLRAIAPEIREKAKNLGFEIHPNRKIEDLSIAEQQRVEILKALMAGAEFLIFDEPTSVLTDQEATKLMAVLGDLVTTGVAVVLVTHKLTEALDHSDRITVMRGGRTMASVGAKEISAAELTRLIVGADVEEPRRSTIRSGSPVLRVVNLKCADGDGRIVLEDATFTVAAGEIYGIAGVSGNGQMQLAEAMMQVRPPMAGKIDIDSGTGHEAKLAYVPADRYAFGLAGALSIVDNFTIRRVQAGQYGGALLNQAAMRGDTALAVTYNHIQGVRNLTQKAALLSGGNAQKLVLARELASKPHVILAHSPSRGLDVRACAAVHEQLLAARASGVAVVLISDDLDEILNLSDRIGVMNRGRIVAEFSQPVDRQQIGTAMIHHA